MESPVYEGLPPLGGQIVRLSRPVRDVLSLHRLALKRRRKSDEKSEEENEGKNEGKMKNKNINNTKENK